MRDNVGRLKYTKEHRKRVGTDTKGRMAGEKNGRDPPLVET
jgi:hypothetical protein